MTDYEKGYYDALKEIHDSLDNIMNNKTVEMLNGIQALAILKMGIRQDIDNVR